jgi:hypothetical protein
MAVTGVAAAVALVVAAASAISERPLPGLRIAVVPAAAVLLVGQIWVITLSFRRYPGLWFRFRPLGFGEARELFFSPLRGRIVLGIHAVFVLGWLSTVTAIVALSNGVPATGRQACPYREDNHGSSTCVSKAAWQRAVATEERAVAGVMMGFFVAHFGVAWSEVLRSRQA